MSQRIKAAACRGEQWEMEDVEVSQGSKGPTAIIAKKVLKKTSRKTPTPPKQLDLSVTISMGSSDIDLESLKKMDEFIENECISGLCSIERGGALLRLHL